MSISEKTYFNKINAGLDEINASIEDRNKLEYANISFSVGDRDKIYIYYLDENGLTHKNVLGAASGGSGSGNISVIKNSYIIICYFGSPTFPDSLQLICNADHRTDQSEDWGDNIPGYSSLGCPFSSLYYVI